MESFVSSNLDRTLCAAKAVYLRSCDHQNQGFLPYVNTYKLDAPQPPMPIFRAVMIQLCHLMRASVNNNPPRFEAVLQHCPCCCQFSSSVQRSISVVNTDHVNATCKKHRYIPWISHYLSTACAPIDGPNVSTALLYLWSR